MSDKNPPPHFVFILFLCMFGILVGLAALVWVLATLAMK